MKAVAALVLVLCCLAISHAAWNCREGPRLYNAFQIDAGDGRVVVRDTRFYSYFLIGKSWHRLSTSRFTHVSVGPAGLWATGTNYRVYKYVAGYFLQSSGPSMRNVDAGGNGQVVGIITSNTAYCLRSGYARTYNGRGNLLWNSLSKRMKYYSCGQLNRCWGVDTNYRVFFTQRIAPTTCGTFSWRYITGLRMKMIEVGTDGKVFGLTRNGKIYQRLGISSRYPFGRLWRNVPMCTAARHVTYDLGKLWVVTNSGLIMYCT